MNRISKKRLKKIAREIALCHETLDVMASESINKITGNDYLSAAELMAVDKLTRMNITEECRQCLKELQKEREEILIYSR